MCGIAGFWRTPEWTGERMASVATAMADTLVHRGPDDAGIWTDPRHGIALGFRRLAILDLTPAGHQPMQSADGRYTIVYNGEIYNFRELRTTLHARGHAFRGHSDTEVVLAAFVEWGIAESISRLAGMFAMAVWDAAERSLTFVRDRLGKKPLYYWHTGEGWIFGSELRALRPYPEWTPQLNAEAVADLLRVCYVASPRAIYEGIAKLPPGHLLTLPSTGPSHTVTRYWDPVAGARRARAIPLNLGDAEIVAEGEAQLKAAVARRMVSDVPLGALLSGGIDSSLVVALMQSCSATPVRTFTIGSTDPRYDESASARAVARHLGTEHVEFPVTAQDALDVVPRLAGIYDEPFADYSQLPTLLVSKLARRSVTVCLSGDGGDELMGGYNRYMWAPKVWSRLASIPVSVRRLIASGLRALPAHWLDALYRATSWALPPTARVRLAGDKMHKLAQVMSARSDDALYEHLVSAWHTLPMAHVPHMPAAASDLADFPFVERMMLRDLMTYLPDDILVKVDRATMAVGLEARAPLLDHDLLEWGWRLPPTMRIRAGQGKWLLRQVLYRYVPRDIVERPKIGFGVPLDAWLRMELRSWAEELLTPWRLEEVGLDASAVRRVWAHHQSGRHNEQGRLWPVLMLQAWRQEWRV